MILFLRQATLVCFTKQPKKGNDVGKTKLKPVTIYLTKEEFDLISKEAFEHGTSLNYFLRALIDQYSPIKLPPLPK
ncbi:MAG: hypothetical protein FD167_4002, partial [bacterium]